MSLTLTKEEISRYRKDGLLFPKTIMTPSKASEYLALLENYEAATGGPVKDQFRYKCHLVFPWINELMRNDGIFRHSRGLNWSGYYGLDKPLISKRTLAYKNLFLGIRTWLTGGSKPIIF
jgi:hypothetical protein